MNPSKRETFLVSSTIHSGEIFSTISTPHGTLLGLSQSLADAVIQFPAEYLVTTQSDLDHYSLATHVHIHLMINHSGDGLGIYFPLDGSFMSAWIDLHSIKRQPALESWESFSLQQPDGTSLSRWCIWDGNIRFYHASSFFKHRPSAHIPMHLLHTVAQKDAKPILFHWAKPFPVPSRPALYEELRASMCVSDLHLGASRLHASLLLLDHTETP